MITPPPPIIISAETPQPELGEVVGWPIGSDTIRYEYGIVCPEDGERVITLDNRVFNGFTRVVEVLKPYCAINYKLQKVPP